MVKWRQKDDIHKTWISTATKSLKGGEAGRISIKSPARQARRAGVPGGGTAMNALHCQRVIDKSFIAPVACACIL